MLLLLRLRLFRTGRGDKWSDGSLLLLLLRYLNALILLASAIMLTLALRRRTGSNHGRALAFFLILLSSASAVITAGWFANIFDASCLFFISSAVLLFQCQRYFLAGLALGLAAFCKEIHVLSFPLFTLIFLLDKDKVGWQNFLITMGTATVGSIIYWGARLTFIPLGSSGDIHGFESSAFMSSLVSFLAGFLQQSNKFNAGDPIFWAGLISLAVVLLAGVKDRVTTALLLGILILSAVAYWGMFGYQGDVVVTSHNFVGRLYLLPFTLVLFFVCFKARHSIIAIVALASLWGTVQTYRDHRIFQQVYAEIYDRADKSEDVIVVHYPEKPLSDPKRGIEIGDHPRASLTIDVTQAALTETAPSLAGASQDRL